MGKLARKSFLDKPLVRLLICFLPALGIIISQFLITSEVIRAVTSTVLIFTLISTIIFLRYRDRQSSQEETPFDKKYREKLFENFYDNQ